MHMTICTELLHLRRDVALTMQLQLLFLSATLAERACLFAAVQDNAYKYKPRQGDAVLFYSLTPDLQIDRKALHGGCPIKAGSKWVATKWLHDKPLH